METTDTDFKEKDKIVNPILSDNIKNEENNNNPLENSEKLASKPYTNNLYSDEQNSDELNSSKSELSSSEAIQPTGNINEAPQTTDGTSELAQNTDNTNSTSSEPSTIEIEEANTTNCLALTIQKDHKLVAIKNVIFHSIKITWKAVASAIVLTIIKLFS